MLVGVSIIIAAYLIGSIPVGLLVGKALFRVDIRALGSGNLGATNAYRILGPVPGIAVFAVDVAKGAAPVLVALRLSGGPVDAMHSGILVLTGMAAIAGHNWSLYLGFKGGKGVSTAGGVLLVLFPVITGILFIIWLAVLFTIRYVSLASIVISLAFPALVIAFYRHNPVYIAFSVVAAAVVIFKHRSNIGRMLGGMEPRIWSGGSEGTL